MAGLFNDIIVTLYDWSTPTRLIDANLVVNFQPIRTIHQLRFRPEAFLWVRKLRLALQQRAPLETNAASYPCTRARRLSLAREENRE
jgi:hypothetical protein